MIIDGLDITTPYTNKVRQVGDLTDDELIHEFHISVELKSKITTSAYILFIQLRGLTGDKRIKYPEMFI